MDASFPFFKKLQGSETNYFQAMLELINLDLWTEIKKLQGKELETLDQRKAFMVCEVLADRVIIKTSGEKERAVH
jgi:hypothetical protein